MSGKLFVIDGTDGSGKNTQAKRLLENLILNYNLEDKKDICMVSFPRYGTAGCTMVEKYLHGEFGKNVKDIDPYTASMFYSIDRSISFLNDEWGRIYRNGGIVIADRYYTANLIHQGAKLIMDHPGDNKADGYYGNTIEDKLRQFETWLIDNELTKMKLPMPDKIFWLMSNKEANEAMIDHRAHTDNNHITDIHESNLEYLDYCRMALKSHKEAYEARLQRKMNTYGQLDAYTEIVRREEFINVFNTDTNSIRTITDIENELLGYVVKYFAVKGRFPNLPNT